MKPLDRRVAVIAAVAALLVVAGITVVSLSGSDESGQTETMPTHSYIPGVITPPEDLSEEPSASVDPTLASSALGLVPSATPPPPPPPPAGDGNRPPSGVTTVTSGPGCGSYSSVGSYRDGRKGWVDHGDGKCGSTFVSVPMSGDARRDDPSAYGVWTFSAAGMCDISVHVPDGDLTAVGGNPTVYFVYDRSGVGGTPMASFAVKQVDKRGQWVSAGRFRSSGTLTVQLLTRGQDWDRNGPTYAHHAASAIKANCTP
ncbi:hypothetical protein ADL03_13030 [Nocardia sp. NRRL S-836]|nr:hypothetical protein ADL03_13030 [Nocardia sp. NRRL S-836]